MNSAAAQINPLASAVANDARGRNMRRAGKDFVIRAAIVVAVILAWSLSVRSGLVDKFFVSSPEDVFAYLRTAITGELIPNTTATLLATLLSFVVSGVAGILAGLILMQVPSAARIIDPFMNGINSLPRIALAPIFVLWFGLGITSKIALGTSMGFFVVLSSTMAGMKNVDPILIRLSVSLGCSGWQRFTKIQLRWATPSVFAGLKLALIYCFLGVVTSEMLASRIGLGQLIMTYSTSFRMDAVVGILVVMSACSVALVYVADVIESRLLGGWIERN